MVISNEVELIERLKSEGVELKIIKKVLRTFAGWRVYFRVKANEKQEIKDTYSSMIEAGYTREQSVKLLSEMYEKSIQTIKNITREQGALIEF